MNDSVRLYFIVRREIYKDDPNLNMDWVAIPIQRLEILHIRVAITKAKQQLIDSNVSEYEYWVERLDPSSKEWKKVYISGKSAMDYFEDDGKPLEVL